MVLQAALELQVLTVRQGLQETLEWLVSPEDQALLVYRVLKVSQDQMDQQDHVVLLGLQDRQVRTVGWEPLVLQGQMDSRELMVLQESLELRDSQDQTDNQDQQAHRDLTAAQDQQDNQDHREDQVYLVLMV